MKKFLLILTLLVAGPLWGQSTYTAASSAEVDVNAVINGPTHTAINGDIIQIPCSGSQSVTWSSTLTVNANITLTALGGTPNTGPSTFGAGTNCLTITSTAYNLFQFNPTYSSTNNITTIQNITLVPGSGAYTPITVSGTGTSSGMPLLRVDNIQFGNGTAVWQYGTGTNTGEFAIIENNMFGVADHNTLYTLSHIALVSINLTSYLGVGLFGDNSWAQPDTMGGANNFFLENNSTYQGLWPIIENEQTFPNIGGSRGVVRFNQTVQDGTFALNSFHGLDTDGRPRAGRHVEVYGNQMQCINGVVGNQCYDFFIVRGGTGMFFGNVATVTGSGTNWKEVVGVSTLRAAGDGWSNVVTPSISSPIGMGSCGDAPFQASPPASGNNAWGAFDENDGTAYYTGAMGSGTGGTTVVDSGSPGWATNQWLNSGSFVYFVWDQTQSWISRVNSNASNNIVVNQAPHGYINGGTMINAAPGDTYEIRRAKWCLDGAGVGQSALLQNTPPVLASTGLAGAANPALDPFYEFDNTAPAISGGAEMSTFDSNAVANIHYFTDNALGNPHANTSPTSPFNGSSGVGFGTLANRPTSGAANPASSSVPGTAYFATDQGSWNTSGNGFGQGILYAWVSGAWAQIYEPYTYPHPLAGGTPQAASPTASPTGGTYGSTQSVTLSDTTPSSTITYCLDTTNTCTPSTTYTTAISVPGPTQYIRAFATASGYVQSNTVYFGYIIGGTNYTWTPTISPGGTGSISGTNSGAGSYASGTTIGPLTPIPAAGYVFSSWSGVSGSAACSGSTTPCPSFTIGANSGVTANFTTAPACSTPQQLPPNFSGTYPPSATPLSIGFTSPTPGCTLVMTLDGTIPNSVCTIGGSTQAYAGQNISVTTTMIVRACQAGYTPSTNAGGTWTISGPAPPTAVSAGITVTPGVTFK